MTLKYNQGHWKWYKWVKLNAYYLNRFTTRKSSFSNSSYYTTWGQRQNSLYKQNFPSLIKGGGGREGTHLVLRPQHQSVTAAWFCIWMGSRVRHCNISLTAGLWGGGGISQDSAHKPQLFKKRESRSGLDLGISFYQPSAFTTRTNRFSERKGEVC